MRYTVNSDFSENVVYNNPLFPAHIKDTVAFMNAGVQGLPHWHPDIEFEINLSGSVTNIINGEAISLKKGQGLVINSQQMHFSVSQKEQKHHFICILLHPDLLSENEWFRKKVILPLISNRLPPYVILDESVAWQADILSSIRAISEAEASETSPFVTQEKYFHIMGILAQQYPSDLHSDQTAPPDCLRDMILFIQNHSADPLTLDDIAKAGNCCRSKCTALFRQYLSRSPIQYLRSYRLTRSTGMLLNSDRSITEIAFEVGFHGASYYCEIFKKVYGISPEGYRQRSSYDS